MANLKSLVSLITLLAFLAVRIPIAHALPPAADAGVEAVTEDEYEEGDYVVVKQGEEAPYDGFLFDSEGLAKVIANKNFQLDKLKIEKESEIAKLNIEIKYLKEQQALELKINKELSDNIVAIKDKRIQQLEDSKKWDDVKLFGSMLLGMALSVTIFYAAVKITNVNQ
jgi:hypothetical protein